MKNNNYDSELCGSLPIHLINHVQPYGLLLVLDRKTLEIVQASENVDPVFGKSAADLVSTLLSEYVTPAFFDELRERFSQDIQDKIPGVWPINGRFYLAIEHIRGDLVIVELDREEYHDQQQQSFVQIYKEIKYGMGLIQSSSSIEQVAENCARELKRLSGFDKVMVYRFDKEWNGTVIAEVMEPGMESYLGITFPASDVPQQARQLYLRNPYRMIPDRNSIPVKIYPVINPVTNTFIDLADCNVRSVAAVHLEYLRNMGVVASMSTRILVAENLWGLIACHHRTALLPTFEMRSVFEMLGSIVSARITSLQSNVEHAANIKLRERYKTIVESAYRERRLSEVLLQGSVHVLDLFDADGAIISEGNKVYSAGTVPGREELRELMLWLHARQLRNVYSTDSLSREYEQAENYADCCSGILVIPINSDTDEYLMLFRPEVVSVVTWGGNPEERIQFEPGSKNYHPRRSFEKWQEQVKGCSRPWKDEELIMAENLRSFIYEFLNQRN